MKNKFKKIYSELKAKSYKLKANGGFTLIELLTVTAIIFILTGMSLANYQARKKYDILILDTQKVAQMIRRAQNLALSPQAGTDINGFGINLATSSSGGTVTLFKDMGAAPNNVYDAGEQIEALQLDTQVKISSLTLVTFGISGSPLDILYIPPDPLVSIKIGADIDTSADIKIELANDATKYKTITATATGLVEVQ